MKMSPQRAMLHVSTRLVAPPATIRRASFEDVTVGQCRLEFPVMNRAAP